MPYFLLVCAALLVVVDQLTKHLAIIFLSGQPSLALWPGVFELQYCENSGVAFSMLENQRWIFIPLTLIVMIGIVVILFRSELRHSKIFSVSCTLILAGGIGNLIDRIARSYVIDFLYFKLINFPIFNFADCCVTVGAVMLFAYLIFGYKGTEDIPLHTLLFGIRKKSEKCNAEQNDSRST